MTIYPPSTEGIVEIFNIKMFLIKTNCHLKPNQLKPWRQGALKWQPKK
jgi:hypothetical protein